jgi:hypothetical protein
MHSAHRKDRDTFIEINPRIINFNKDTCSVHWAKREIKTAIRTKPVYAEIANEGEMMYTMNDGFLITLLVAQKDDWKVSSSHHNKYFLNHNKLHTFYDPDPNNKGMFIPKPIKRRVVELTENVRLIGPWKTLQYAKKGDILMYINKDDIYAVPIELFNDEFSYV